jgi:hypothetical protein
MLGAEFDVELLAEEWFPRALAATEGATRVARRSPRPSTGSSSAPRPLGASDFPTNGQGLSACRTSSGLADSSGLCERLAASL